MAILNIIQLNENYKHYNDSCLFQESSIIDFKKFSQDKLNCIVRDLLETLYNSPSGIGLAANQVGLLLKISVVDLKRDGKSPIILINPKYSGIGDLTETKEVCLSFPNMSVTTQRFKKIEVSYFNIRGEMINETYEGFKATAIQHEIDHLYGKPHVLSDNFIKFESYAGRANKIAEEATKKLFTEDYE